MKVWVIVGMNGYIAGIYKNLDSAEFKLKKMDEYLKAKLNICIEQHEIEEV
jgi:hypothetical protein